MAYPLEISPTHPMLETTTGWGNSCAPFTLISFGRNRISSSSRSFSAFVCESFIFEPCIILLQWRAEFGFCLCPCPCLHCNPCCSCSAECLSPVGSLNRFLLTGCRLSSHLSATTICNLWLGTSTARKVI